MVILFFQTEINFTPVLAGSTSAYDLRLEESRLSNFPTNIIYTPKSETMCSFDSANRLPGDGLLIEGTESPSCVG